MGIVLNFSEKLSVIIITKNEEKNIARCLKSVNFADEVILLDSESTDNTRKIAEQFQNVKIYTTQWLGYSETKILALTYTTHNWVLWIDADECVSNGLIKEWFEIASSNKLRNLATISLHRKNFFLGHFVKYSGWNPDLVTRVFHKNRANFNHKYVHEGISRNKNYSTHTFSSNLFHYSYSSLFQYFYKMNLYGIMSAKELKRMEVKVYFSQIFISPFWTFIKFFFLKRGYMDGLIGITICTGAAFSCFIKYTNYFFMKKYGYVESID